MVEDVQKRRLSSSTLAGVDLAEDSNARKKGGAFTSNHQIRFDPVFLEGVGEEPLVFTLAHELGEMWFLEHFEAIGSKNISLNPGRRKRSKVGWRRHLGRQVAKLWNEHDNYADTYAMRKLFESGWSRSQVDAALVDSKSYLQSYLMKAGQPDIRVSTLNEWLPRVRVGCYYLWIEFQRSHAAGQSRRIRMDKS